jgi:hypothetical protein
MNGWLHSDGHRENILTAAYTELGIGYLPGESFQGYSGATLWSQELGVRSPSATAAPVATPPLTAKTKPVTPKRKPKPKLHQTKHR